MDNELIPSWVTDVGPAAGVILIFVLAILRGWLVPKRTMDAMIEVHKQRADEWKAVSDANAARATAAEAQSSTLATELSTQSQLLRSIKEEAARRRTT